MSYSTNFLTRRHARSSMATQFSIPEELDSQESVLLSFPPMKTADGTSSPFHRGCGRVIPSAHHVHRKNQGPHALGHPSIVLSPLVTDQFPVGRLLRFGLVVGVKAFYKCQPPSSTLASSGCGVLAVDQPKYVSLLKRPRYSVAEDHGNSTSDSSMMDWESVDGPDLSDPVGPTTITTSNNSTNDNSMMHWEFVDGPDLSDPFGPTTTTFNNKRQHEESADVADCSPKKRCRLAVGPTLASINSTSDSSMMDWESVDGPDLSDPVGPTTITTSNNSTNDNSMMDWEFVDGPDLSDPFGPTTTTFNNKRQHEESADVVDCSPKKRCRLAVGPTMASSSPLDTGRNDPSPPIPASSSPLDTGRNDPSPPIPARSTPLADDQQFPDQDPVVLEDVHNDSAGEPVIPSPSLDLDPPRRSARRSARIAARNITRILTDPLGSIIVNGRRCSARLM